VDTKRLNEVSENLKKVLLPFAGTWVAAVLLIVAIIFAIWLFIAGLGSFVWHSIPLVGLAVAGIIFYRMFFPTCLCCKHEPEKDGE